MKFKTAFLAVLTMFLLTASPEAQTTSTKTKFDSSRLAPVKVFSSFDASGKPILVLSRGTLALTKAKASQAVATTADLAPPSAGTIVSPGQILFLGATGAASPVGRTSPIGRADTMVVTAPATADATPSASPLSASIERQIFVGDLPRDTSTASRGLTPGTTAGTAAETAIGPNGFPIFIGTAAPQSGTLPIGPNGFPLLTTTGPQSGIQPINPNGFPATNVAPVAQPGLTREGESRSTTLPSTTAPVTTGASAGSTIAAPNTATAVMSTPATVVGAAAPASPQP